MVGKPNILFAFVVVAAIGLVPMPVFAGGLGCAKCGCQENLCRVCRPIYTTKYIEITCWDSVCEDFCIPPRSRCTKDRPADYNVLDDFLSGKNSTTETCKDVKIRSSNKLVRKTYFQPVQKVVWVVEYYCRNCSCPDASNPVEHGMMTPDKSTNTTDARQSDGISENTIKEKYFSGF
jgi:hypothetical protein